MYVALLESFSKIENLVQQGLNNEWNKYENKSALLCSANEHKMRLR